MRELERLQKQIDILQETVNKLRNGTTEFVKPLTPMQKYKQLRKEIFNKYFSIEQFKSLADDYFYQREMIQQLIGNLANRVFVTKTKVVVSNGHIEQALFNKGGCDEENTEYIGLYSEIYENLCKMVESYLF